MSGSRVSAVFWFKKSHPVQILNFSIFLTVA
jgi:hypothetical protein